VEPALASYSHSVACGTGFSREAVLKPGSDAEAGDDLIQFCRQP
jgi:hypothetical protein